MKSVMSHSFSQVPKATIPRSSFDRSHGLKTTLDAGYLVPIYVDEALPGDTFNLQMTALARLATPIVPVMDNLFMDFFFFAVPYRLVWDNFQKFMGEQIDPDDSTDFLIPVTQAPSAGTGGYLEQTLGDYFGIPIKIPDLVHSALWGRSYNLIWNEWFRDQNLQDSLVVDKDDGPDSSLDYLIQKRGKRHDYFTSCLPWPQKGPAVPLPLGTSAPIRGWNTEDAVADDLMYVTDDDVASYRVLDNSGTNVVNLNSAFTSPNSRLLWQQPDETGTGETRGYNYADLSEATASTINALRQAFQLQKLYERDARGGTRYTEIIRSHFGVTSPDARLQRPEYLGGGTTTITVHPIAQTAPTGASGGSTPQGNLAGFATSSTNGVGFTKSFTEHTILLGLCSTRADLNYQQGLNRMWSRRTRWDMYWPALSHIGEQAVLNKEIYAQNTSDDDEVFGYQERYAEYRYKPSQITGLFRSQATGTLQIWHLAQNFSALPELDDVFITEDPPVDRITAVPTQPNFLLDLYFQLKCARPMPVYSVPGLIDHF